MELSENVREKVLNFQRTEITEYHIYRRLAKTELPKSAEIIEKITVSEGCTIMV